MSMCVKTLVLCLAVLASVSGVTISKQLYVRPTSDPTAVCPREPCLTLDQYVENSDMYITSNTEIKLLPGQHDLTSPFVVRDVENITIEGLLERNDANFPIISYQDFTSSNQSSVALQFYSTFSLTVIGVKIIVGGKIDQEFGVGVYVQHGRNVFIAQFSVCLQQGRSQFLTYPNDNTSTGIAIDESRNVQISQSLKVILGCL